MRNRALLVCGFILLILLALAVMPGINRNSQVSASVDIFASPVQAGCYIAAVNDCRIHVEPFTINLNTSSKLVKFLLVAVRLPGGVQTTIYDWRPDQSNPAPALGATYSPSLVAQDFAAACGKSYEISLQGQDTLDGGSTFSLGLTNQFTCPSTVP